MTDGYDPRLVDLHGPCNDKIDRFCRAETPADCPHGWGEDRRIRLVRIAGTGAPCVGCLWRAGVYRVD